MRSDVLHERYPVARLERRTLAIEEQRQQYRSNDMKTFWWDSNTWHGTVCENPSERDLACESSKTLDGLLAIIPTALGGLECPREADDIPKFGFRPECVGPRTLREFLRQSSIGSAPEATARDRSLSDIRYRLDVINEIFSPYGEAYSNLPSVDQVLMLRSGGCTAQRMAEEYEIPTASRARQKSDRGKTKAHLLIEEVAAVVEAATIRPIGLREQLIRVAATTIKWVEALDRAKRTES